MKTILLTLILTGLISLITTAQQKSHKKLPFEIQISAGGEINSYSHLNSQLQSANLDKPSSFLFNGGVGIGYRLKNILIAMHTSMANDFKHDDFKQSFTKFYVSTNALRFGNFITSPEIGIGLQDTRVYVPKEGQEGSFDDFMTGKSNQVRLDYQGTAVDFAVSLKKYRAERNSYFPLFRVGYRLGLDNNEWEVANATSFDAPKDRISVFYAQLILEIGH